MSTPHEHSYNTIHLSLDPLAEGKFFLDLGAGDGRNAERYASRGARVTAVDLRRRPETTLADGITWIATDVRTFVSNAGNAKYDAVYAINLIQFLDKAFVRDHLAPFLAKTIRIGGTCAIRTFRGQPEPAFDHAFASFWESGEIAALLREFTPTACIDYDREGTDYQKKPPTVQARGIHRRSHLNSRRDGVLTVGPGGPTVCRFVPWLHFAKSARVGALTPNASPGWRFASTRMGRSCWTFMWDDISGTSQRVSESTKVRPPATRDAAACRHRGTQQTR